ncbi:hypothetical protein HY570_02480 [Candidatus Micrarchaeota archaeon]|nr:hypothetical protein [Candidatus Micrarchaeota archaeon]
MSNKKESFPVVDLKGTPEEIGLRHGELLEKRIRGLIGFFQDLILKNDVDIDREKPLLETAGYKFRQYISEFSSDYVKEIDAIAKGAGVDARLIYALNARSEIISWLANECTAVYFRNSRILGQNWDWAREMEELAVVLRIEHEDGHRVLTVTQPGIIGKIGLNSSGLGVCENSLNCGKKLYGLPLHVLLRAVLDSKSISEAKARIKKAGLGRAGNFLVADANGNYMDIEFACEEVLNLDNSEEIFVHTNHYIGKDMNERNEHENSFVRLERAKEIAKSIEGQKIEDMKRILLDKESKKFPICRPYVSDPHIGTMGTVCSIIMDLQKLEMSVTDGNPLENEFRAIKV